MNRGKRMIEWEYFDIGYKERGWNIKFVWTYAAYAHMCLLLESYFNIESEYHFFSANKLKWNCYTDER